MSQDSREIFLLHIENAHSTSSRWKKISMIKNLSLNSCKKGRKFSINLWLHSKVPTEVIYWTTLIWKTCLYRWNIQFRIICGAFKPYTCNLTFLKKKKSSIKCYKWTHRYYTQDVPCILILKFRPVCFLQHSKQVLSTVQQQIKESYQLSTIWKSVKISKSNTC